MIERENRYILKETLDEAQSSVGSVHLSENGQTLVTGSVDKKVRIYRLENKKYALKEELNQAQSYIWSLHMSGDSQTLASRSADGKVQIYRTI